MQFSKEGFSDSNSVYIICDYYRLRMSAGGGLSPQPDTQEKAAVKLGSHFSTHYVLNRQYVLK